MDIEALYKVYLEHNTVITDSRQISAGCLFFALKGANFDGNQYAGAAIEAGAAFAIVDDSSVCSSDRFLLVDDVLSTLQKLANFHRSQFSIPVVAITGTNGKTTTKELVAEVLKAAYPVHCTKGNLNNHIGVPLTLLSMPTNTEIAIIEMGANHAGDIAELCAIANPTHGLVTNIGRAHLEGFGSLDGVKRTKSELYMYLAKHNGLAFINRDEKYLTALSKSVKKRIFYGAYSETYPNDPKLINILPYLGLEFLASNGAKVQVQTQLPGSYNVPNMITAITIGSYFKVSAEQMKTALAVYVPTMNRSQVLQWQGATILLDAYNANPSSMTAALAHFKALKKGKSAVVIGDMFELGEDAEKEHQKIYTQATKLGSTQVITVGKAFGGVKRRKSDTHFDTTGQLKEWFVKQDWAHYEILLKGSRGMKLETLLATN
jgi:UDP-N-acetylmuramoyl-tripeptide--D-alanyl-D-alanine ligase